MRREPPEVRQTLTLPVAEERLVLRVVRLRAEMEQAALAVALAGVAEVVEETTQGPEGLAEKAVVRRLLVVAEAEG